MKHRRGDELRSEHGARRGAALVVAMICLLLVSMLSAVLVRTALAQRDQLQRDAWQLQAEWLAQAAMERALTKLAADRDFGGETWRPVDQKDEVIGAVEITFSAADVGSGRVLKLVVNVPDDPVNRAHVERELNVADAVSSSNGGAGDVSE